MNTSPLTLGLSELRVRHATGIWEALPPLVQVRPDIAPDDDVGFLSEIPLITALPHEDARGRDALARQVDLLVDPGDWPAILRTMATAPHAARVLAQVLRATEILSAAQALTIESLAYGLLQAGGEFQRYLELRPLPRPVRARSIPRVSVSDEGGQIRVTLSRRERGNAIDARMRAELCEALAAAGASQKMIRLDGRGPHFCIGGDLEEFGLVADPLQAHDLRLRGDLARLFSAHGGRMSAQVHGKVIGAGAELSSFAETVLCAPGTTWRLPEVAMGLLPGSGGTVSIPRRIGRQRTLLMCLADLTLDTATALDWGLADAIAHIGVTPPP